MLPLLVDEVVIFSFGITSDGSGGTSDEITFLLYFFAASRIAVLMI